MAYDVTKLTNLGQMKSALQQVKNRIDASKSSRTVVTVNKNNWAQYDALYRYPSILTPANYHYYDVHLDSDTSNSISIMCANADIRAKIESNSLYLYCYGTVPTQSFDLEIIDTPISTNTVGLSYDIGDDFLVYPKRLDDLASLLRSTTESIANDYSEYKTYDSGDLVIYDNELYRCKSTGVTGSWDSSKWDTITLDELLQEKQSYIDDVESSLNAKFGSYMDPAKDTFASNINAWNVFNLYHSDRSFIWDKLGITSSTNAAGSTTYFGPSVINDLKSGLGTFSDTPSPTGTTAWSRLLSAENDVDALSSILATIILSASNVEVAASKWTTGGITGYTYKAVLNMDGVTADHFPIVQFDDADALEFDFSPTVTTGAGTITIYCKTKPNDPITINSILCIKPSVRTVT